MSLEEEEEGQQRGNENGDEQHLTFQDPFDYELQKQEHPSLSLFIEITGLNKAVCPCEKHRNNLWVER